MAPLSKQRKFKHMPGPSFDTSHGLSPEELRRQLADRVRAERRAQRLSQAEFAKECGIPLRTYKRFELSGRITLESFLRIVIAFRRTPALELLFPPSKSIEREPRRAPLPQVIKALEDLMTKKALGHGDDPGTN